MTFWPRTSGRDGTLSVATPSMIGAVPMPLSLPGCWSS